MVSPPYIRDSGERFIYPKLGTFLNDISQLFWRFSLLLVNCNPVLRMHLQKAIFGGSMILLFVTVIFHKTDSIVYRQTNTMKNLTLEKRQALGET